MKKIFSVSIIFILAVSIFSIAPLRPDQKEIRIISKENNKYVIENMRWGFESGDFASARFTTATIDPENIEDIYYWSKNFPPKYLGAHGMLMFRMKTKNGVIAENGQKDIGFVVSVEAWLRTDQEYSMVSGMKPGNYPIIYTVTSYTDGIQRAINIGKLTIGQYKLKLNHKQKVDLVKYALEESAANQSETSYHTTRNSCVTCAVKLINKVLPEKQKLKIWLIPKVIANPRVVFPRLAPGYLISRKIAEKMDEQYTIESEINITTQDGDNYTLDISTLPGNWDRRAIETDEEYILENYLRTYYETIEMAKEIETVDQQTSITLPMIMNEISNDIIRLEEEIIEQIQKNPEKNLDHYIEKEYYKLPWSKNLNKKIMELSLMGSDLDIRHFKID